ncbi:hypothetical protein QBC38DRAFT_473876 [Podospora fimiseda]|uniref:Ankyrin n=1 Tax=Podospora fimiseda TaxID=252190 RepID=A0AAN7H172_9PEZI|nr:hypothetical protein QBC38DRAFT_473876 [Podospora fimiseda]
MLLLLKVMKPINDASITTTKMRRILKLALERSYLKVADYLLRRNLIQVSPEELLSVVRGNKSELVSLLLQHGADANAVADPLSGPPIHHAVALLNRRLVELLLDEGNPKSKANINQTGGYYWSVLHACLAPCPEPCFEPFSNIEEAQRDMFDFLLERGASIADSAGPWGTVLHKTVCTAPRPLIEHILAKADGKLSFKSEDEEGRLPGHFVASFNRVELIDLFLPDDETFLRRDKQGRTPIHITAAGGLGALHMLRIILDKFGVDILLKTDDDGRNIFHWVCRQNDRRVFEMVLERVSEKPGLKQKLFTTRERCNGWYAWDIAKRHSNERFLPLLERPAGGNMIVAASGDWPSLYSDCDSCFGVSCVPF